MKKIVLRNGLFGLAILMVTGVTTFLLCMNKSNFEAQETLGYLSIVLSLLFVYVGILQWRNRYNNGVLSFGKGMKIGALITLFPSAGFGLFSVLVYLLMPQFNEKYYTHYVEQIKKSAPPDKLEAMLKQVQAEKEMFSNPFMQFIVMFLTVFVIGIIITVISSLILQRKQAKKMA